MPTPQAFETLRENYKPEKVSTLFVGESRPQGNTFFYCENSNLYHYTKQAFKKATKNFSLEKFKTDGFWLYDVCSTPVNKIPNTQRRKLILAEWDNLLNVVKGLKPKNIIIVKKGDMKHIFEKLCKSELAKDIHIFNLPFPSCGNQLKYVNELSEILNKEEIYEAPYNR